MAGYKGNGPGGRRALKKAGKKKKTKDMVKCSLMPGAKQCKPKSKAKAKKFKTKTKFKTKPWTPPQTKWHKYHNVRSL